MAANAVHFAAMTERAMDIPVPDLVVEERARTRNPFASPGYRYWWLASIVAGTGVGIQTVTVPLFIRDRVADDHRAIAIAAALICQTLPGAILALIGGVVADRTERRRILVRTYSLAAAVSLVYVGLSGFEAAVVWPVFLLSGVVGGAGAFTNPARQSMMPQILAASQLQNGVILGTMAFMATLQFGGPTIGGLLADGPGLTVAFAMEVAALLVAALIFGRVATDLPAPTGRGIGGDLADGLRYIRRSPGLLGVLLLGAVPGMFLMGPFSVTIVLVVQDVFHASDKFVGILWGCFGGGIVLGSMLLTVVRTRRRGWLLCVSVLLGGVLATIYGAGSSLPLAMVTLVVFGITGPAVFINFGVALLQEHVSREMMGRVMSMWGLVFSASTPVGYLQAGLVANAFGPQATVVSSGIIAAVIGLLATLLLRPVHRLE